MSAIISITPLCPRFCLNWWRIVSFFRYKSDHQMKVSSVSHKKTFLFSRWRIFKPSSQHCEQPLSIWRKGLFVLRSTTESLSHCSHRGETNSSLSGEECCKKVLPRFSPTWEIISALQTCKALIETSDPGGAPPFAIPVKTCKRQWSAASTSKCSKYFKYFLKVLGSWSIRLRWDTVEFRSISDMSQLLLLGKFEYGGGPIFKVVLEC